MICSYTGERCTCQIQGLRATNLVWRCAGSGNACPATEPADNATCQGNLQCPYPNGAQCNCQGGRWNCSAACPTTRPAENVACTDAFQQCSYGAAQCLCFEGSWFCN